MKNTIRTVALLSVLCLATAACQKEPFDEPQLLATLAGEGHTVSFRSAETTSTAKMQREIVTYTTQSRPDAEEWAATMRRNGYSVTIVYNGFTGIYTCTATR